MLATDDNVGGLFFSSLVIVVKPSPICSSLIQSGNLNPQLFDFSPELLALTSALRHSLALFLQQQRKQDDRIELFAEHVALRECAGAPPA